MSESRKGHWTGWLSARIPGLKLRNAPAPTPNSTVAKPTNNPTATTPVLWRVALVVMAILIVSQTWLPQPVTAQGDLGQSPKRKSGTDSRSRTNHRPNASTNAPGNSRVPRAIDPDSIDEEVPTPASMVRSNRVAQAVSEESVPPVDSPPGRFPELPNWNVNQLVDLDQMVSPQGLKSSVGMGLAVTVLSLAPAILMMSTCFVRFIVVLSLLRQALGTPNLPPNQVLMGLSLCLTFLVMAPVWNESYQQGIRPYTEATSESARPSLPDVFDKTVAPLRRFMSLQIEKSNNADAVWMFVEYQRPADGTNEAETWQEPETYDDVPLTALLPAYLLSELKTAFLIGFQIYLPFLIIDLVVASVLMSMGLSLLSPTQVSLPFKLLLFVLIDGWTLTVGMLLQSVRLAT